MKSIDLFKGCLLGGAAGDALGFAVELLSEEEIKEKYSEKGITEFEIDPYDGTAHVSDDTQMTLFTAGGLLTGRAMNESLGYPEHIYRAYTDWYRAQFGEGVEADETVFGSTWLYRVPELNNRRGPGDTCMAVLSSGKKGTPDVPVNNSKTCGGVMRVSPVGLFFEPGKRFSAKEIDELGAKSAALTHGHPSAWLSAALLTRIINTLVYDDVNNKDLKQCIEYSLDRIKEEFSSYPEMNELEAICKKALDLAAKDVKDIDAVHELGEGREAQETIAIAICCAVRYQDDLGAALIAAVNHKGDSDSTGSVTGSILGAYKGCGAIPEKYLEKLELRAVIEEIAEDLHTEHKGVEDFMWTAKYILNNYKM